MSRARRLASGSRVGGGRLRVDAARAVHKLRDYQLADPAMWALEAIRAAVASGATAIHLDGDADDVWVAWEGEPLAHAELPRLLDELVAPDAREERRALHLLATAVNTALGLGPRWVDVFAIESGAGVSARYAPRLLASAESGAAEGLRNLAAAPAAIPAGAPAIARGSLVHLRRFPALEALSLLATGQEPREIRLARRACEDLAVPLRIGRGPLARHHAPGDLLRVRIDSSELGEGREIFLAITELARFETYVDYAELGVVLATQPIELGLTPVAGARVPIRARIDARRLPTNASRSAVRREETWCKRSEELAAKAMPELVRRLVTELGPEPEASWTDDLRARLRAAAMVLAASAVSGADWREKVLGDGVPALLAALFDAPIARDALGRARSIRELARGGQAVVHTGAAPLPEELAPWIGNVPWAAPGDPIGRLWGASAPPSAAALVEQAAACRQARDRWLARKTIAPVLETDPEHAVIVPLAAAGRSAHSCVPPSIFSVRGLAGEVALLDRPGRAETRLLVEGRETEHARRESPIASRAIATASELELVPDHAAVADDDAKRAVLLACSAATVVACEAIARHAVGHRAPEGETARFLGDPPSGERGARLVRAGARIAAQILERTTKEGPRSLLAGRSPLLDAPAWPTADGGVCSLGAIAAAARGSPGVVGWVARAPRIPCAPQGRIVLVLEEEHDRELLALLLGERALVDYRGRLDPAPSADTIARGLRAGCVATLAFDRGQTRGAIGWARGAGAVRLSHLGHVLASEPAPGSAAPVALAVDDDRLVPGEGWRALRERPSSPPEGEARALESELACAVIDRLIGRERADLHAPPMRPAPDEDVLHVLLRAYRAMPSGDRARIGSDRVAALRAVPLFRRAWAGGLASAAELVAEHGELLYVPALSRLLGGSRTPGYDPIVLPTDVADGAAALFAIRARNGEPELERRQKDAQRELRLAALRSRVRREPALPGCHPVVPLGGRDLEGLLGFDPRGSDRTIVECRIDGRTLCETEEPLPGLRAVVDGDATIADDDVRTVTDGALGRIRGAIREATASLLVALVRGLDQPLAHDEAALRLVAAWMASAPDRKRASAKKVLAALREAEIFATVQGGRASFDAASTKKSVRVAEAVDRWVEAGPHEHPSPLDEPILVWPAEGHPIRAILSELAGSGVRNLTADVRRLLAARRVRQGLAERPRVGPVKDERFRWTLEDLAQIALPAERAAFEALGIGELALGLAPTRITISEAGSEIARLELDIRPPVAIACEPAGLALSAKITPRQRERLDEAARTVVARALRHLIETVPHADLPVWLRRELRGSALAGGPSHLVAISNVPVFETTTGRWVTPREVGAQKERFGQTWFTSTASVPEPLDPERIVLRLERSEATQLGAWGAPQWADDELRLDAIARANRARPPLESIGPSHAERAIAIAEAALEGTAQRGGAVLALHPAHVAARGIRAHVGRRPLGAVPDRAAWPTLAFLDDPALTPDRTWSAPIDDGALARAREEIEEACERALETAFPTPDAVLASVRVDRALSEAATSGRGVQARGVLWIATGDAPAIEVIDANGETERVASVALPQHPEPVPLPLGGRVAIAGVAGPALAPALGAVGRAGYQRMVRVLAERVRAGSSPDRERDAAELVRAATLGCLDDDGPAAGLETGIALAPDDTLGALAAAVARGDRVLVVPEAQRAEAQALARGLGTERSIVDDGSLAARWAIAGLGRRAVMLATAVTEKVLGEAETAEPPPAPEPPRAAKKSKKKAPPPVPSTAPAPSPPVAPELTLPRRLEAAIARSGASSSRIPITIDLLAYHPLAARRLGGEVELALRHPLMLALERRADHAEAVAILAAHAIGVFVRGDDDEGAVQLAAIERLLAPPS